ncbi:TetR/AcrR family transcriptional regulator [Streptomyces botrytidirepellens]|uniref:TetR family transcriptional regulator n=1 Tax=Streptomyces botrytidirepellens TaxID=2486417 RepID=A0A3M8VMK5_9ACTN|nr:TetR/AcrR family transcriptional regulator C-terminal domain-containing protein [Streptomyces botrytidirepellens]RNG18247.1 TetR family transcriptional regulator [Streptomyces botrytidirepellens]
MTRRTMSRAQIVSAAIELLDEEGLDGLSMRRLGQRLGSAATSVYWHVQSKENLIALASDRIWGEISVLDPGEVGWRRAAVELARSTYGLGVTHHWLIPAIPSCLAYGAGMARCQDHSYAIFEAAGFTGVDLDWAVNTLFTFVIGAAYQDSSQAMLLKSQKDSEKVQLQLQEAVVNANQIVAQFPRLQARVAEQAQLNADPRTARTDALEFGLGVVLDGMSVRLDRSLARLSGSDVAQPS